MLQMCGCNTCWLVQQTKQMTKDELDAVGPAERVRLPEGLFVMPSWKPSTDGQV